MYSILYGRLHALRSGCPFFRLRALIAFTAPLVLVEAHTSSHAFTLALAVHPSSFHPSPTVSCVATRMHTFARAFVCAHTCGRQRCTCVRANERMRARTSARERECLRKYCGTLTHTRHGPDDPATIVNKGSCRSRLDIIRATVVD